MKLRYWKYDNPFIYPFTISKGTKTHQPCLVVELEHMGIKGYGEAPAINYYNISVEKMIDDIERKKNFIEKYAFTDPERYWHYLHHLIPNNNFLICALDIAAWDLYGKMRRQPLYKLWGYEPSLAPLTDYTIGIDTIDNMLAKINDNPWPIYKIKLGTPQDINIIEAVRGITTARIRVDANAGWKLDEALIIIDELQKLDVEFIEQPLAKDDWEGMKLLYEKNIIPLMADESCVTEQDVNKCAGHFHGINIKLTKCGGITPARRMIANAHKLGLSTMIGCMNETTIGSAAIAHLLPSVEFADLDGPLLLASDIASGLIYDNGKVAVSSEPGLGIRFSPEERPL
jgi:L-alanine-DL-glutamate epimerase-like enolase superfamily enzyme